MCVYRNVNKNLENLPGFACSRTKSGIKFSDFSHCIENNFHEIIGRPFIYQVI